MLQKLEQVKEHNKEVFAAHLAEKTGQVIDPHSIFDVQVKRMHEYKRQHLNAMNIAAQYLYIKNNPNADVVPKTYIFGAKAAPGYYIAKQMIRLLCKLGDLIDADPVSYTHLDVYKRQVHHRVAAQHQVGGTQGGHGAAFGQGQGAHQRRGRGGGNGPFVHVGRFHEKIRDDQP